MAVGITPTKLDVDNTSGALARDVNLAMVRIGEFKAWLDAQTDAVLTGLGYTSADIANLRSAYGDLALLAQVYQGAQAQTPAKDFRVFASRLSGFGF